MAEPTVDVLAVHNVGSCVGSTDTSERSGVLTTLDALAYAAEEDVRADPLVSQSERDNPRSHPHVANLYRVSAAVAELIERERKARKALRYVMACVGNSGMVEHAARELAEAVLVEGDDA